MRRAMLLLVPCVALVTLAVVLGARPPYARPALACTGGTGLEDAAIRAKFILLGDAVDVGDAVNRAPTLTATRTRTATAPVRAGTPVPTPPSPPEGSGPTFPPYATPTGFTLAGYGVTLKVVRGYVAPRPLDAALPVDRESRALIEREIRELETNRGISSCPLGAFTFKFEQGARYLVFATDEDPSYGLFALLRLRVVGGDVILEEPGEAAFGTDLLYVDQATYRRFFASVLAETAGGDNDIVRIIAERVRLSAVLRAVGYIRGDASIAPPDTGSAGLASGRW